ncbi:MAG: hypothetical protein H0W40_16535 [Methylibium sp.]|uniref:hypothetical protein n=1 Tax=Methylibium sp. TaxID=2067992 RepID=UPI0017B3CE8C|nr:hypothetical protein [Methylibium sp.]MBA3598963.1 hypothetical protein [Methylibium sp.]
MSLHRCLFRSLLRRLSFQYSAAVLAAVTSVGLGVAAPIQAAEKADLSAAAGQGLRAGQAAWPRWQGRLAVTFSSSDLSGGGYGSGFDGDAHSMQSLSLLGDYYFTQQGLAPASQYSGGFRASGGLIVGARRAGHGSILPASLSGLDSGFSAERRSFSLSAPLTALDGNDPSTHSVPYLGVGYTGLQGLKGSGGGWGFSADVGVMALQPRSAVRLGQQSIGDTVRGLEISPLLQLGVSYSF